MAKFQKKKIQDMKDSGFGQYRESTGGGHPFGKGDSNTRTTRENGKYREANNNTQQPRTDDGKFTYKSVNGQSIDPKYGPSRGKTVNPLLTGGENGVYIDDRYDKMGNLLEGVETQFYNKSGKYYQKFKDKWYQKGSEYMLMSQGKHHKADFATRVAGDAIWNVAKRMYDEVRGEFTKESKVFSKGKAGARGAEEQAAYQLAKQTGEEQAVIDKSTGGIKLKPGTKLTPPKPAPQPTPTSPSPVAPGIGGNQPQPGIQAGPQPSVNTAANVSAIENADYTPKYSDEDIQEAIEIMKSEGFSDEEINDFNNLSPKEKDDYIDKNFGEAEEEEAEETETVEEPKQEAESEKESEEPEEEEDSEAIKKIKNLGFAD